MEPSVLCSYGKAERAEESLERRYAKRCTLSFNTDEEPRADNFLAAQILKQLKKILLAYNKHFLWTFLF